MKRTFTIMAFLALTGQPFAARAQTPTQSSDGDAPIAWCAANSSFDAQYIRSVKSGSIYNITGGTAGGYADYSALWTAMTVGTAHTITVTGNYLYSSDQCAIWVDWNNNQVFTDANEAITVTGTPGIGPYTASITPPTGTAAGNKRMRIRIANSGSFTSCGTTTYGETEDYTIMVGGTPPTTDIGVIDVITPLTSTNLDTSVTVKVRIYNFGTVAQSNFMVSYRVNSGAIVNETVTDTLAPGAFLDRTFAQKANLAVPGTTYLLYSWASIAVDQCAENDGVTRSVFHGWANNQFVVQGEYFINTDPGVGNGVPVTGTFNLVDITANITNLPIPTGSKVYVRFKSQEGNWSFPRSYRLGSFFLNTNATLSNIEYFIDSDPGQGAGTAVAVNNGTPVITNLNLAVGSTVYMRARDNFGRWSEPTGIRRTASFPNQNATPAFAEYFVNTDPGRGNGIPVPIVNGTLAVNSLDMPIGGTVYLRIKDSFERWSQPVGYRRLPYYTGQGGKLSNAEYFLGSDPGQGNAAMLPIDNNGNMLIGNLNLPSNQVVYIRVRDSLNRWSTPRGYKSPAVIPTSGSSLAGGEYFINTDPGKGNGIPVAFTGGVVTLTNLDLNKGDILYIRAKDSYNRWGSPRALKYRFKDFQKAEYRIKLASSGTMLLPQLMQLIPPPDSSCGWIGKKDAIAWQSNDTIWARFQDQDGFYTNWRRGVVASAGPDKTICQGGYATLTATGGDSYLWSTGQAGISIQVSPPVSTKYWVTVTDGAGAWSVDTAMVIVNPLPSVAGTISGPEEVCAGSTASVYVVPVITNATSYHWILPQGATGSSSANSILVTFPPGAVSGNILVNGINQCGSGTASSKPILVNTTAPGPAGAITGPTAVTPGTTGVLYSVTALSAASSYQWSLPPGATITSGAGTNSITVSYSGAASSGNMTVYGINSCGNGLVSPVLGIVVTGSMPNQVQLGNINVGSGISNCYNAAATITVAGSGTQFLVENGGSAILIAGQLIRFLPGTKVVAGGYLNGYIATDNNYCLSLPSTKASLVAESPVTENTAESTYGKSMCRVYPNPTSGKIMVEFTQSEPSVNASVLIINLLGKIVFSRDMTGMKKDELSIEKYPDGVYLLKAQIGNEAFTFKIIKQ